MKITKKRLRQIIREEKALLETRQGRKAARAAMDRSRRVSTHGSEMVEFEDMLHRLYPDIDEYFDGGYDDEGGRYGHGAWVVMDEVEGRYVDSGVKENTPTGKLKAYHYVNGRETKSHKALQKAHQMMEAANPNASREDAGRFRDIIDEIGKLVNEAWEIAGRPERARGYWYNGILGRLDPGEHGMGFSGISMADTLSDLGGLSNEDMGEAGYNDGFAKAKPAHPDDEYYMVNYREGFEDATLEDYK
jgi:hypothetical protein